MLILGIWRSLYQTVVTLRLELQDTTDSEGFITSHLEPPLSVDELMSSILHLLYSVSKLMQFIALLSLIPCQVGRIVSITENLYLFGKESKEMQRPEQE
jgi:hypothetical protein